MKWDDNKKTILFSSDDILEDFYEHYDYELDELPLKQVIKVLKN